MRKDAKFWFTLFVLVALGCGLWSIRNFPTAGARLFPTVFAVLALLLAALQVFMDWRHREDASPAAILDLPVDPTVPPRIAAARALKSFGWIFGFAAITLLFSLYVSLWLFVPTYLMVEAKSSWWAALLTTVVLASVILGILSYGFDINVPHGVFFRQYLG